MLEIGGETDHLQTGRDESPSPHASDHGPSIIGKIEAYANDPASQQNNVKSLKGIDAIRLRVGDWRVIMQSGVVLDVLDIGPRGGIYD